MSEKSPQWLAEWPEARDAIHRFVRGRLPVGVDPDDVSQQVVVKLLAAGTKTPPADRVKFWALRVARNVVADLYRGKSFEPGDLPAPVMTDVETTALARLRCEAAATAYTALSMADRRALAEPSDNTAPLTNRAKLRRTRARRKMRERAERTVGISFVLPRLKWLLGPASAAAIAVPFCFGLAVPGLDSGDSAAPSADTVVASDGPDSEKSAVPLRHQSRPVQSAAVVMDAADGTGAEYFRRVAVEVPVSGPAGYGNFDPPPEEEPPPLACARNLRVVEDVCVDHPLR